MYLMFADEADQDGEREFLVYAAVFFPTDTALKFHESVVDLREKFGFHSGDTLKFSTGTKPQHVSRENHTEIKNHVLKLAAEYGCKICCYVVPHAIAKGQDHDKKLKFGINTLLVKFDQFLRENGGQAGVVQFDRTEDFKQDAYLKDIAEHGINWNGGRRPIPHIVSIGTTQNGMSHFCSITDIVVGALRWVINEPDKDKVGAVLFEALAGVLWGVPGSDGKNMVRERGLVIRPRQIKSEKYQADIEAFIGRLHSYQGRA